MEHDDPARPNMADDAGEQAHGIGLEHQHVAAHDRVEFPGESDRGGIADLE